MGPNDDYTQDELDNHANQLNPNNDAYYSSRGDDDDDEISQDDDDANYVEDEPDGGWESADW
jgi:hypothetical protein